MFQQHRKNHLQQQQSHGQLTDTRVRQKRTWMEINKRIHHAHKIHINWGVNVSWKLTYLSIATCKKYTLKPQRHERMHKTHIHTHTHTQRRWHDVNKNNQYIPWRSMQHWKWQNYVHVSEHLVKSGKSEKQNSSHEMQHVLDQYTSLPRRLSSQISEACMFASATTMTWISTVDNRNVSGMNIAHG